MFIVYDTLGGWEDSPYQYETAPEALAFFEDIHKAYYNHYRIVEVINSEVWETYDYESFQMIFDDHGDFDD